MNHEIKEMPIAELKAAPYNPRTITEDALKGLQESINRFGLVQPVVFNKRTGHVVAGHQRLKALKAMNYTTALTVIVDYAPEIEVEANLSMNNPAIAGSFTSEADALLAEIEKRDKDIFQRLMLDQIDVPEDGEAKVKNGADEEGTPGAGGKMGTGGTWRLGRHLLHCGDATDDKAWGQLMEGKRAALVFTDPPYGVNYRDKSHKFDKIKGDDKTGDNLANALLVPALKNAASFSRKDAAFYIWHASSTREDFAFAMKQAGLLERQYIIWAKPHWVHGWSDYRWAHEPCFYANKAGEEPAFYGNRAQSTVWRVRVWKADGPQMNLGPGVILRDGEGGVVTVSPGEGKGRKLATTRLLEGQTAILRGPAKDGDLWEVSRDGGQSIHPTQKPVELGIRAMENSSMPGEVVVDPFLGSGSTLIAAEATDRICHGLELSENYCQAIIERWEKFTGHKAEKIN